MFTINKYKIVAVLINVSTLVLLLKLYHVYGLVGFVFLRFSICIPIFYKNVTSWRYYIV